MKKYLDVIRSNLLAIVFISLFRLVGAGITFLVPIYASNMLNAQLSVRIVGVLFALVFAGMLLSVLLTFLCQHFTYLFKYRFSKQLYEDLFHVSYDAFNAKGATYYVQKTQTAVNNYSDYVLETIPDFVETWVIVGVSSALLCWVRPSIFVLLAVTMLIQNRGYKFINKTLSKMCVKLQNVCSRSFSNVTALFNKTDYVKQKADCRGLLQIIDKDIRDAYKTTCEVNTFASIASYIVSALVENVQYIVYIFLTVMMLNGGISASKFLLGSMMVNICLSNVRSLTRINLSMKDVNASWEFVENELHRAREVSGDVRLGEIESVEIRHADIGYEGNELVHDVNMTLRKGDIVFLKAETGTGKSSLVKNLVGFYQTEGVFLNDVPIDRIQLESLRRRVCYVSQQPSVINGSLADNVFMGEERDAAKEAELAELSFFGKFMENGRIRDWEITDSGSNLSGGDKQKIAIARLFLEQPDVLILDEITSSMDDDSSTLVFDELVRRFSDRIIIMISHNSRIRQYANRCLQIEDKKLTELPVS